MSDFDIDKDYYKTLEILKNASDTEIATAYKTLAARYHPDKHQGNDLEDLARDKLTELNEAHKVLSNNKLKARYNLARSNRNKTDNLSAGTPCTPHAPDQINTKKLFQLIKWALILFTSPIWLKFIRTPRTALVVVSTIAILWFVPKLIKKLRKPK